MPLGAIPLASAQDGEVPTAPVPETEVVITARYGEAQVEAESEVGEAEIASYGADTIGEVLTRLPTTGIPGEDEPLILVNGKEVGFDRSILAYPPEALNRIGILRPEAAGAYGQPPDRRVVNLVLKRNFASRDGTASGQWATRGGQHGESINLGQVAIAGAARWNIAARASRDGALLARDREAPSHAGAVGLIGEVAGLDNVVTRPAAIADFPSAADGGQAGDASSLETLLPSRRNLALQLGIARPVGKLNAALNLTASSTQSHGLRSPSLASERALRQDSRGETLGASLSLSARFGQWQTNLAASYTRGWSYGLYERGAALGELQAQIDRRDSVFSPDALPELTRVEGVRTRSRNATFSTRFSVSRPLVTLPAGPVTVNLSGTASRNRSEQQRADLPEEFETRDVRWRDQLSGQVAVALPVLRRRKGGGGALGDLGFDIALGAQKASGSSTQTQLGLGVRWAPHPVLRLRAAIDRQELVPGFDQLDDAPVETVRRVYDVVRQETADVLWITGGNPALRRGSRESLTLSALVRLLNSQVVTLNFDYRSRRGVGGIAPFPELGPAVEAAFPERISRDMSGRLIAVDARAINIAEASEAEVSSGIALRLPDPEGARGRPGVADTLRITLTARHSMRLRNRILTREGLAPLDLLRDSGQARHRFALQATVGQRSFGLDVDANWSSEAELRTGGVGPNAVVRMIQPVTVNLGMFLQPGDLFPARLRSAFFRKLRLSIDIDNVLDRARTARLTDGSTAPGYRRDEIDPLGRTIRLSVRTGF